MDTVPDADVAAAPATRPQQLLTAPQLDPAGLTYKPNLNLRGPQRLVARFAASGQGHARLVFSGK
jgi:hypothetical protein